LGRIILWSTGSLHNLHHTYIILDADTVITRDFMPHLLRFEREFSLIVLREGIANGGMWHLRASQSGSAALWIIRQIERRSALLVKYGRDVGWLDDQNILCDSIRIAAGPDPSAFDFGEHYWADQNKNHPVWKQFPQKRFEKIFEWKNGTVEASPYLALEPRWDADTHTRYDAFANQYGLRGTPLLYADIRVPFKATRKRAKPDNLCVVGSCKKPRDRTDEKTGKKAACCIDCHVKKCSEKPSTSFKVRGAEPPLNPRTVA